MGEEWKGKHTRMEVQGQPLRGAIGLPGLQQAVHLFDDLLLLGHFIVVKAQE